MNLKDMVAIITGSGQGIGRAFALSMAQNGAKVIVTDINAEKVMNVAKEIKDQGLEAEGIAASVASEEDCLRLARECHSRYGKIDVLVNNASVFSTIKMKSFLEITEKEWDDLMAVNVKGVFLACKAVVPYMKEQNWGRIINITSSTFFNGRPYYLHYVTSKGGVIGLTRALAREVGEFGITVNAVAPGATVTEVPRETVSKEQAVGLLVSRCIKRAQEPADLVGIVKFLATEEAGFITGQTIVADGGKDFN